MTLLLLVCMFGIVACTPHKRVQTIVATETALNAARDGFLAWDRQHQLDLVRTSDTRAELDSRVAAYLERRLRVDAAFTVAYQALVVAARTSDEISLQQALAAAGELVVALKKLMGGD